MFSIYYRIIMNASFVPCNWCSALPLILT